MAKIDALVEGFLAQKKIAVVGVSDKRETGCNAVYRTFKRAGYSVSSVNPRITTFEGAPCYPDLKSVPEKPEAVFILANPKVTEQIVQQCVDLGIKHVWMHCMMGTKPGLVSGMTSVSQEAVQLCREHGIAVIPGSCPNQFLNSDFGHRAMRVIWRTLGFLKVSQNGAASGAMSECWLLTPRWRVDRRSHQAVAEELAKTDVQVESCRSARWGTWGDMTRWWWARRWSWAGTGPRSASFGGTARRCSILRWPCLSWRSA
jgi:predicted CoA-binding protein